MTLSPGPISCWGAARHLRPARVAPALLSGTSSPPTLEAPLLRVRRSLREEVVATSCPAQTPRPKSWKSLAPGGAVSKREGTSLPPQSRNSQDITSHAPPHPYPSDPRQRGGVGVLTGELWPQPASAGPAQPPPVTSYWAPALQCCHLEVIWGTAGTHAWPRRPRGPSLPSPPRRDGPRMGMPRHLTLEALEEVISSIPLLPAAIWP